MCCIQIDTLWVWCRQSWRGNCFDVIISLWNWSGGGEWGGVWEMTPTHESGQDFFVTFVYIVQSLLFTVY